MVACLTAMCEVLGLNPTMDSYVYYARHCSMQPWVRLHSLSAVPRSSQTFIRPTWNSKINVIFAAD